MTTTHSNREIGDLPSLDVDPFGSQVLEDPLPFHRELREAGPIVYLPRYDVYAMGRYHDVHRVLVDWQSFESSSGVGLSNFRFEEPWRPPSLLLEADPPRHDAPRHVLSAILSARAIRRLRESWLQDGSRLVDDLLDGHASGDVVEVDGVTQLAAVFPLRVFPDAVGIGQEGREHLLPYGDFAFNAFGPANELAAKGADRLPERAAWIAAQCQRDALIAEGFGASTYAAADRGDVTHEQAPLMVRSLLTAGVDTTVHGLGAVLHAFATNPEQYAALRRDPGLTRVAFDEAVRWDAPVQTFFRTATTDVTVHDTVIPDGAKVLLFLASANRDPRRWERPDDFDLTRDPSGHVGFGMGIHQCVGQHVARLEADSLLRALVERVSHVELAHRPRRHHNNTLRGWASLPLRLRLV